MQNKIGILYVVATPIGNLEDITFRAISVLKKVDKILVEDTRHARRLLNHYSIQKPTVSLHNFNERERVTQVIDWLQQGNDLALISDAGTPLISDPGFFLVRALQLANIKIEPIPGPCAAIAALSVSGLSTEQFRFIGFLPAKQHGRLTMLEDLRIATETLIFYEAPHRLLDTLQDMIAIFGKDRPCVIARELTKLFESIQHASLEHEYNFYQQHADQVRGEIVILIGGAEPAATQQDNYVQIDLIKMIDALLPNMPVKSAAALVSDLTGERKNTIYELALTRKNLKRE